uniref:Uncharacterized protein n=1 Tax=Anopheles dirus TaxID=7168 RepID=A0A182NDD8_9DIPT
MNSNNVIKFSGEGDVTYTFTYPNAIEPAIASPIAADLPRPRPAVSDHRRSRFDRCLGQHIVQDWNLITRFVAHHDEHRSMT